MKKVICLVLLLTSLAFGVVSKMTAHVGFMPITEKKFLLFKLEGATESMILGWPQDKVVYLSPSEIMVHSLDEAPDVFGPFTVLASDKEGISSFEVEVIDLRETKKGPV